MSKALLLLLNLLRAVLIVLKPNGTKSLIAENIAPRQQLITIQRKRKRAPNLTTTDRITFAFLAGLIRQSRLNKIAIIIKPATILAFHKYLKDKKYSKLYS